MQRRLLQGLLFFAGLVLLWQACLVYTRSQTSLTQQRLLGVQQVELDRQLNQFSFIPKLLASDVEIRRALRVAEPESLLAANQRLSRTQQDSGLDFAFLLDHQGVTIASSNWDDPVSFVGVDYSFRPYFQDAIDGQSATFFAVGVTTGVPGYFIAEPVSAEGRLMGVVVAKVALGVLVDGWSQLPYESLVSDDFGIIILSTRADLLYTPTEPLSASQVKQLLRERRYELQSSMLEPLPEEPHKRRLDSESGSRLYLSYANSLSTEPWHLTSLVPQRRVQTQALLLFASLLATVLIAYLFARLFQQQQQLVKAEKRNSLELEEQVLRRTAELETAQKRLISEANFAMLGRMSAAINHEINQPLASLRLNLASLRTMMQTPDAERDEIEQIVVDSDRTTKRIGRVISSLRSIARNRNAHFETVDLRQLLEEVRQTVIRERPTLSAYVEFVPAELPVTVSGDEVLIQQTLLNLLYNAFDAVLKVESPRIQVTVKILATAQKTVEDARAPHGWAVVSVIDNGVGVSPALQETLFEPFSTSRQLSDGLGLGLTIARQIAEDHGGELLYEAGIEGSCFVLSLPCLPSDRKAVEQDA